MINYEIMKTLALYQGNSKLLLSLINNLENYYIYVIRDFIDKQILITKLYVGHEYNLAYNKLLNLNMDLSEWLGLPNDIDQTYIFFKDYEY